MTNIDLDPIPQTVQDDPHPVYRILRESHPVHYVEERDLWVVSRYEDVLAAVKDPDTWSSAEGVVPSGFVPEKRTLIVLDPPNLGDKTVLLFIATVQLLGTGLLADLIEKKSRL